ncbi:hypothetical protein CKAN_00488500 [Cinnamomum micranthum f. kanehirae]|uniref:Transposase MuDR plant domain-containing protein n=1 Tax=Cinnamomum micranthum f. kanehirae TaxID=337451 RepID=A0A443ND46_9MAGN|nr:hypothetical protein CKAN_00488500 [Cinnamomum micranthum f. kanehirae]
MSDCDILIIFHYDGNFEFDMMWPVYNGGKQKMRFQRIDKRRYYLGKSRDILLNCKGKEVNDGTTVPELPTVDLQEDNDMHFSIVRDITSPLHTSCQEIDVDIIQDGAHYVDENDFDEIDLARQILVVGLSANRRNVVRANPINNACVDNIEEGPKYGDENHFDKNNFIGQIPVVVMGADRSNVAEANPADNACPLSEHSGVNFVDDMVPEELNVDVGNNSAREMWIGHEFPDRDTFRKTQAKFAIYGNFTLKHLRTNMYKVTACCKDQNCPWRIHASIVESGPQFEERVASLYEDNPSIAKKDLDHDAVALILGRDNRGRVKGTGDGVSKTSIKYSDPYKKALQKEQESQVILQAQVENLEKRLLEVESRDLRREMEAMFAFLSQANTQMQPSTERGSSSQGLKLQPVVAS